MDKEKSLDIARDRGNVAVSLIVIVVLIIGAVIFSSNRASKDAVVENVSDDIESHMEDGGMMDGDDKMMDDDMGTKDTDMAMSLGTYEDYSPEKVAANDGAILFFHASWCPTCKALDSNLSSNMKNIPGNVAILKVNYDTETELKNKYGITYQHQLVQVDADGKMIQKWSGSLTLDQVLQKL